MVLLETMAMGVPVVAAAVDGVAEVMTDGAEGVLLSGWDAEQFSQSINALLNDTAARQRLIDASQEKVRREFSRENMTRNIEAIYKKCLTERASQTRMPAAA